MRMLLAQWPKPLTEEHGGVMTHTPPGRQIVVGVDGSAASAAAVRWAVREARLRHAAVRLVYAYDRDARLHAPYAPWYGTDQDEQAAARALLDRAAELARPRLPAGRLIAELVNEPPARALLDRSAGAEMLVLGTSRPAVQPGEPPLALGPVARICLRRAHCPVVIAPDGLAHEHDDEPGGQVTRPRRGTLATTDGQRSALPPLASAPLG
jgi:nucleotide-binding universal stress UspA family protein